MSDYVWSKTATYGRMLGRALEAAEPVDSNGETCIEMAQAYHDDGTHFLEQPDLPNALAAFAYGHGWLDAGVRLGVVETADPDLHTV